jgi:tetratricopeptide (TPR) repeat protein
LALWAAALPAAAGEKLAFGPPEAWVRPAGAAALEAPPKDGGPWRILRVDHQLNLEGEGQTSYYERVAQVTKPSGLSALGTITISWRPERETVTVHKLRVLRGGETIDLLAKQSFKIIQREAELEQIFDGSLTATLQPEDLRLGDVLELAYTRRYVEPATRGRADIALELDGRSPDVLRVRAVWPAKDGIRWRGGSALPKPKVVTRDGVTELSVELKGLEPPKGPTGAPRRYWPSRDLEFSEFASWADVAATVAPEFEAAGVLGPDSPVRAEAVRIRAGHADLKARAAAALKLVQQEVRYLGLVLTDGGYTPVHADKTWSRRFGECKAKSVLLVALLRELGITAEPVLVNAFGDPILDRRLPRMSAFNHVIVRAEIEGRTYWLDGTRDADTSLEALQVPRHDWALPIRREAAALIALTPQAPTAPLNEMILTIDASDGIDAPARVTGEIITRGGAGDFFATMLSGEDREKLLKSTWSARYKWIEVKKVEYVRDEAKGEVRVRMEGAGAMPWRPGPNDAWAYLVPEARAGYPADFKREPDMDATAPFAAPHPVFTASKVVLKLPYGGRGFKAPAPDVDRTVAARRFIRRSRIEGDTVTIESSMQSVAAEFPASEAVAAGKALTEMAAVPVYVQAPAGYGPTEQDLVAWRARKLETAAEFFQRGLKFARGGQPEAAMPDFARAIELDPKNAWVYANRGLERIRVGDKGGKADAERALELEPRNFVAFNALGLLAVQEGRHADAVAAFGRSADMSPNNAWALAQRAQVHLAMNEEAKAAADVAEAFRALDPLEAALARADVYSDVGRRDLALKEVDAALAKAPKEPRLLTLKGGLLMRLGRRDEGQAAFAASIAAEPTPDAYLTRAFYAPQADVARRLADIEAAEKLRGPNALSRNLRVEALLEGGRALEAAALATEALRTKPDDIEALLDRAEAYVVAGKPQLAQKDFQAARAVAGDKAAALNNLCWRQATRGFALQAALRDCNRAVQADAASAPAQDSQGFVLLRLGRYAEAIAAYDRAVQLQPKQAASLYGRGVAKLRLGDRSGGAADLDAARKVSPLVDEEFADYGVTPEGAISRPA